MDLKKRLTDTTAMRYAEWFSDKEPFIFPPKDGLEAAMRKAKADIKAQKVEERTKKVADTLKSGGNILGTLKEMQEEAVKEAKIQETVGFQFKDW